MVLGKVDGVSRSRSNGGTWYRVSATRSATSQVQLDGGSATRSATRSATSVQLAGDSATSPESRKARLGAKRPVQLDEPSATSPAPAPAQAIDVEPGQKGAAQTSTPGELQALEPACPMPGPAPTAAGVDALRGSEFQSEKAPAAAGPAPAATPAADDEAERLALVNRLRVGRGQQPIPSPAPAPAAAPAAAPAPPADIPGGERVWCGRTKSLHEVVSRYGPETQIRPPLPGYPLGQGFSIVPADWLVPPTADQLLKGLHTSVDDGPEPLVTTEPVNPSPTTPARVVVSPVPLSRAQQPPEGSRLWGDAPCLVNNEPWLLRASRLNGGKEFALLVSADGQRAGSCPMEGVALVGQGPPQVG